MAGTVVSFDQVNSAASAADEAAVRIRNQANATVGSMQAQAAQFTGPAGNAFRRVLDDFRNDLDRIVLQRLETLADGTREAASRMAAQDDTGRAAIERVGSSGTSTVTAGLS